MGQQFAMRLLDAKVVQKVALLDLLDSVHTTSADFNAKYGPGTAMAVKVDVTNTEALEAAFDQAVAFGGSGKLDVVINNAGIATPGLSKARPAVLINLLAVIEGTRLALDRMDGQGSIVNIASYAACVRVPFSPVYGATKSAVLHFSRSLKYKAAEGIRVTALCPSFADTPMVRESMGMPTTQSAMSVSSAVSALGTLMTAEHVANEMLRLVQDESLAGEGLVVTPRGTYVYEAGRRPSAPQGAERRGSATATASLMKAAPVGLKGSVHGSAKL